MSDTSATDWHDVEVRVRYCETDAMGFLHHGGYINYFEVARTELFRAQGGDYRAMEQRGYFLVVVKMECQYKRPARYDDLLNVRVRLNDWTGAKLLHEYDVRRGAEQIAVGKSTLACVNRAGEVQRLTPELLFDRLSPLPESPTPPKL